MDFTTEAVLALAPDDASAKAARGLTSASKWATLVFDTAVVDMTEKLDDPVELLFGLGVPSFACTPDAFPGLMAAAIRRDDVNAWAAAQGLVTSRGSG